MTNGAKSMTTADAVVATLVNNGIKTVFGIPGVQNDHLLDAFQRAHEKVRFIHSRHEQGAAYMALGAAMATGQPACYAVVPGPGFLNTTAALSTAYACNAPVLAIAGQIPSALIGRKFGLLHEIPDQLGTMRSLTKWADRISSPIEGASKTQEAFRQMRSGRPRPVGLECPMDVWPLTASVAITPAPVAAETVQIDLDAVASAAKLLGGAKHPLIVCGGGAQHAGAELAQIAEMLQAPVMANRMGKGALDARHQLAINADVGRQLWADADVVLAVGTRLQIEQTGWGLDEQLSIVRIDADAEEFDRVRPPAVGILGDSAAVLRSLIDALPAHNRRRASRVNELQRLRAASAARYAVLAPQLAYLEAIRAELPEDGIFVDELTQLGYVGRIAWPAYRPRTYLTPGYQGTLGWGLATALGAKVARPDVPVVSVTGDGGFMFNVQELATAVQHSIPIVIVLMNDGAFGNVRRMQINQFANRTIASELHNPDFIKLAESFGTAARRVFSPAELRQALRHSFAANELTLIEVKVGEMPDPWGLLPLSRVRPADHLAPPR